MISCHDTLNRFQLQYRKKKKTRNGDSVQGEMPDDKLETNEAPSKNQKSPFNIGLLKFFNFE